MNNNEEQQDQRTTWQKIKQDWLLIKPEAWKKLKDGIKQLDSQNEQEKKTAWKSLIINFIIIVLIIGSLMYVRNNHLLYCDIEWQEITGLTMTQVIRTETTTLHNQTSKPTNQTMKMNDVQKMLDRDKMILGRIKAITCYEKIGNWKLRKGK